jgi:hypothetical protein
MAFGLMQQLQATRFNVLLDAMHYPRDYSSEEVAADRRALSAGIQYVMTQFGKLEHFEYQADAPEAYRVSLGTASPEYWAKLEPGAAVSFATRHAKVPSGVVTITVTQIGDRDQIRAIDFGIPASVEGAKQQIERVGQGVARRMLAATGGRTGTPPDAKPKAP